MCSFPRASSVWGQDTPLVLLPLEPSRVDIFREGDNAGDPPPSVYGVAVNRGEDAPPVLLPMYLVARPSSGRGTPPAILPSVFAARRSSEGEDAPPALLPANLVA